MKIFLQNKIIHKIFFLIQKYIFLKNLILTFGQVPELRSRNKIFKKYLTSKRKSDILSIVNKGGTTNEQLHKLQLPGK